MPEYRKAKIDKYKSDASKRLSLGAGTLLRLFNPNAEIALTQAGKPYFTNCPDVNFSLSHSGSMAMLSISDLTVGCDIEELGNAPLNIAQRYFSEKENAYLNSITDPREKNQAFYRIWTLKESYIKALGTGLQEKLSGFTVAPNQENCIESTVFRTFDSIPGYIFSCCLTGCRNDCEFSYGFASALLQEKLI